MDIRSDILLVEDNPDDIDLILRALRRNAVSAEVVVVRDGQEALNLLFGSPDSSAASSGASPGGAPSASPSASPSPSPSDTARGGGPFLPAPTILPKVIVLDVKLPRVDGLEVLRRIRQDERTGNVPVVMLSSSNQEQDISNAYALGANSYVVKPVKFEDFAQTVGVLGRYWLDLNQCSRRGAFG